MYRKIKINLAELKKFFSSTLFVFLLVMPASTNYQLKDFGFGNGGQGNSSSPNYSLNAITGEVSAGKMNSAGFGIGSGLVFTNQANVPVAPTFDNPGNYYNKLRLVINSSGNPSNAKFAVAISRDNFVTTQYVQNDNTIGSVLGLEDYQTYAGWGGASGVLIIGLPANTNFEVRAKAIRGKFTETAFGPSAAAATLNPTLTFDVDVSATDSETNPPFVINFGNLMANAVTDSPQKIWIDFSTNGESGGKVYVMGKNAGLKSSTNGHTISTMSGDLSLAVEGFGAQGFSVAQAAGGPLAIAPAYDQIGNNVSQVDSSAREMFSSATPIANGRGSFLLKAKSSMTTPSAEDYNETFTVVASGNF